MCVSGYRAAVIICEQIIFPGFPKEVIMADKQPTVSDLKIVLTLLEVILVKTNADLEKYWCQLPVLVSKHA